jgi:hypothetical protein
VLTRLGSRFRKPRKPDSGGSGVIRD